MTTELTRFGRALEDLLALGGLDAEVEDAQVSSIAAHGNSSGRHSRPADVRHICFGAILAHLLALWFRLIVPSCFGP